MLFYSYFKTVVGKEVREAERGNLWFLVFYWQHW